MNLIADDFQRHKEEIELSLARTIYTQLDKDTLSYDQCREIAQFVLERIDEVNDETSLMVFLEELSIKWPLFESLKGLVRLKVSDASETAKKLQQAKDQLSQINTGGAVI